LGCLRGGPEWSKRARTPLAAPTSAPPLGRDTRKFVQSYPSPLKITPADAAAGRSSPISAKLSFIAGRCFLLWYTGTG